ncbi:MAG: ATP-binding cassette domain-containing protein [Bacteroidales bacterium]|nr:ATP-binding cassette domain-containing protein [Bacteroidales bacterium]
MRRKIHIRQTDSYDCGAASLAAVAAWWGVRLPLARLRRECGCSTDGITLRGIADGAAAIGLNAKAMKAQDFDRLDLEGRVSLLRNLKEAGGPVIIHTVSKEGLLHYMVIYKVGRKSVEIMDPARERIGRVNIADLAGRWSGYVVLVGPGEGYREEDRTEGRRLRLLRLFTMHRREIILALAGSIVLSAMGICNSLLMQMLIDRAIPGRNLTYLIALAAVIIAMIPLSLVIGYLRDLYLLKGGLSIDNSLIIGFMRRILKMDERFFSDYSKGELESRLSDTVKIRMFICEGVVSFSVCAATLTGVCTLMFTFYSRLAAMLMACIPVYAILVGVADKVNRRMSRKVMGAAADFESDVMDSIEGQADIRHFGTDTSSLAFNGSYSGLLFARFRAGRVSALLGGLSNALNQIILGAVLIIGGAAVLGGKMSLGELVSFWSLSAFFISPASTLVHFDSLMNEALVASDRIYGITSFSDENPDSTVRMPKGLAKDLVLDNVCFRYRGGKPLIKNFSCTFSPGGITGITGPNGCGKSTLASLILRDFTPDSGKITYGGIDISSINSTCWRSLLSSFPQNSHLFNATIFDNIAMSPGRRDSSIDIKDVERATAALVAAGGQNIVSRTDKGLLSSLGKGGLRLSSGEKQMVLIARMLYADPDVMVFDEAASNMDEKTLEHFKKLLLSLKARGKCIILITHDERIALCCDKIIDMTGLS